MPKCVKVDQFEKTKKGIVRSISIARNMYGAGRARILTEWKVATGVEFLEVWCSCGEGLISIG